MDEPFAGVDAATEKAIVGILQQLREQGKTVIVVHHDLESAPDYFDWLVLLNVRLIESGPFADTFTADNLSRTYGGNLNLLKARTLPGIDAGMRGEISRQARNDGGAARNDGIATRNDGGVSLHDGRVAHHNGASVSVSGSGDRAERRA